MRRAVQPHFDQCAEPLKHDFDPANTTEGAMNHDDDNEPTPLSDLMNAMQSASEVETDADDEEVIYHPIFTNHPIQSVSSFSLRKGSKSLDAHCDPNCSEAELMAFLTKRGPGNYSLVPRLTDGQRGEPIFRTVTRSITGEVAAPPTRNSQQEDGNLLKTIAQLRAALDDAHTKARQNREKLEAELETEARKARRDLDDQDRAYRSLRRKMEDEHLTEVNRLKQQVRELEAERDNLARKIREANDGTGVSQQVRDQIALFKAEAELAPPPSEFDTVLAKGLEVLLPRLAGAFIGGGASPSTPASTEWKDPMAGPTEE